MSADAVKAGGEFFIRGGADLAAAAAASGDPFLFYAAYLSGFFGHLSAAVGGEMADVMVEHLRPTFVQAARDCDKAQSH